MERRNIDLGIPLTREEWLQVGSAADMQPDDGVLEWAPSDFDVIHVSLRGSDAPKGWEGVAPGDEREVARFVYNEGRPMAQLTPLRSRSLRRSPRDNNMISRSSSSIGSATSGSC